MFLLNVNLLTNLPMGPDGDELVVHRLDRIGRSIRDVLNLALTAQRYRIRRRIFDTLLKRRIYH